MFHISIIGLGLIGTSLGLALRTTDPRTSRLGTVCITGYDQDRHAVSMARRCFAIDQEAHTLADAVREARLIIVSTPPQVVRAIFAQLAAFPSLSAIVTDTASTKGQICAWARELLPQTMPFVGGHPMAGKEQSGGQAAEADLFRGAVYCLTPDSGTPQSALAVCTALVETIGARPYYIDADEHDAYVAGISHLPFLLATALVEITSRSPAWKDMAGLAASGFRDMSRLASGDATMHRDICLTNHQALTRWINDTIGFLLEMRNHLEHHDAEQIQAIFRHAQEVRTAWLAARPQPPGEDGRETLPYWQKT